MGNTHQDKWVDQLPWTLLSRRVAVHSDIGASPSELVFGKTPVIPGAIVQTGQGMSNDQLRDLLTNLQKKSALPAVQTSSHQPPPSLPDAELPPGTTHVFTKNHKTLGLDSSWSGPFPILEHISRSQIKIKVGLTKDGQVRSEIRRLHDVKPAFIADDVVPAERPRRGRKPQTPADPTSAQNQVAKPSSEGDVKINKVAVESNAENPSKQDPPNSNVPHGPSNKSPEEQIRRSTRTTRNPNPSYVDAVIKGFMGPHNPGLSRSVLIRT